MPSKRKSPIRVATMVRGFIPTPRPKGLMYSPSDVALSIASGLVKLGAEVTIFGPQGNQLLGINTVSSALHPFIQEVHDWHQLLSSTDLFTYYIPALYDHVLAREMFERAAAGEFDILHFHHFESALSYARYYPQVPVVYTIHDVLDPWRREVIEAFLSPNQHFISISDNQRRGAPDLPYAATVYNGVDTTLFVPNDEREDYLIFAGRIVPEKGVKEAVQIARETHSRLFIIGSIPPTAQWYFETHVQQYLDDKVLFLGYMDKPQLVRYYQKARALLVPVQWEEPFGLTMAEALACGTPVIGLRRGSLPEIIEDGKNGFLCDSIDEMEQRVDDVDQIDSEYCRQDAEKRFSEETMAKNYLKTYRAILKQHKPKP